MRNIKEKYFEKIFPDGKFGHECSRKLSKFVFEYVLEYDENNECYDSVIFHVEDYREPIPFQILHSYLHYFKGEWPWMFWAASLHQHNKKEFIMPEDVLNNHIPVYSIHFDFLDDIRYLQYILFGSALSLYK